MRSNPFRIIVVVSALAGMTGSFACTANVHDNQLTVENPKVSLDTNVDVSAVQQGATIPVDVSVEHVTLVAPSQTPPPDEADTAAFLAFYFDDLNSEPLLVTAETHVMITIPADAEPGPHKILCRVMRHDDTPTDATFELDITVKAKVTSG